MSGYTDLLVGRRELHERCKFWVRDDEEKELSEYIYNTTPSGWFYAKEITSEDLRKTQLNGVFMFDESLTTIYTTSGLNIKKGDLIEYMGEIWFAQSVQKKRINKNRQFMSRPSFECYIQIKK